MVGLEDWMKSENCRSEEEEKVIVSGIGYLKSNVGIFEIKCWEELQLLVIITWI